MYSHTVMMLIDTTQRSSGCQWRETGCTLVTHLSVWYMWGRSPCYVIAAGRVIVVLDICRAGRTLRGWKQVLSVEVAVLVVFIFKLGHIELQSIPVSSLLAKCSLHSHSQTRCLVHPGNSCKNGASRTGIGGFKMVWLDDLIEQFTLVSWGLVYSCA